MGGNALKNTETERKSAAEYFALSKEVLVRLQTFFPDATFWVIDAYKNKPSFGDMDVIAVNMPAFDYKNVLVELFNANEVVHNGTVWSFDYKKMQVDLLFTKEQDFEASTVYFAFNDLGNFMGRIAHKLGFKYGHNGLSYTFRSHTDHVFAEYNFKRSPREVFAFLGYDYDTFLKGFDELEDVFKYATETKYFNKDIYHLDNRGAVSRVRDKKRKSYNAFMTWLETAEGLTAYPWVSLSERGGRKDTDVGMTTAFQMFPEFKAWYDETKVQVQKKQEYTKLFNGDIVKEVTNLAGEKLGELMKNIKTQGFFTEDYVLNELKTKENVQNFVLEQFNIFKGLK